MYVKNSQQRHADPVDEQAQMFFFTHLKIKVLTYGTQKGLSEHSRCLF